MIQLEPDNGDGTARIVLVRQDEPMRKYKPESGDGAGTAWVVLSRQDEPVGYLQAACALVNAIHDALQSTLKYTYARILTTLTHDLDKIPIKTHRLQATSTGCI
jgi:hypothetical protein